MRVATLSARVLVAGLDHPEGVAYDPVAGVVMHRPAGGAFDAVVSEVRA